MASRTIILSKDQIGSALIEYLRNHWDVLFPGIPMGTVDFHWHMSYNGIVLDVTREYPDDR